MSDNEAHKNNQDNITERDNDCKDLDLDEILRDRDRDILKNYGGKVPQNYEEQFAKRDEEEVEGKFQEYDFDDLEEELERRRHGR